MFNLNHDNAAHSAKAVLAYLGHFEGIGASWVESIGDYLAIPTVSRWENGREQGYVIWMRSRDLSRQVNIAFFEHRNSDDICAVRWEQVTRNSPTIETALFGEIYKTKWDVSKKVRHDEAFKLADWIYEELENFWGMCEE
jgi:hypothetical protein